MRRRLSLLIATWLLACGLAAHADDDVAAKKAKLEHLREEISQVQSAQRDEINRRDSLTRELRSVEKTIADLGHDVSRLDAQVADKQAELKDLQAQQAQSRAALAEQKKALAAQVRAAFAAGREEYLKLLLNQEDPVLLGRMLAYYDYFNHARSDRIAKVNAELDKLARLNAQVKDTLGHLTDLRDARKAKLADLKRTESDRKQVLAQLNRSIREHNSRLSRLKQSEATLAALVKRLESVFADIPKGLDKNVAFASLKGRLSWPVPGALANRFGADQPDSRMPWRGVVIKAAAGTPVKAVARGRVAYADWLPHFGLLVIIEHGDGYMSLYAHNRELYTEAGDWVEAGQVIAKVGESGGQDAPGLYFELRKNGKPFNPTAWVR